MVAYSVIMVACAALFFVLATAVYQGNTGLIHDYHQTMVKESDKRAYGKAFSKGLFVIASSLVVSGALALLGDSVPVVVISVSVLFAGIIAGSVIIVKVQNRFNNGL